MEFKLFDTHSHLASEDFSTHFDSIIENAIHSKVLGLSFISTEAQSILACEKLAQETHLKYPQFTTIWSAGLHPHEAQHFNDDIKKLIEQKANHAHAIGETGLDYHYNFSTPEEQKNSFRFHVQLAKKLKKPLVIHCRECVDDILNILDEENITDHSNPGVLHCFTEDDHAAQEFLKRGFYISFSGILTFKKAESLRQTASQIPIDKILIETDAPYLAPAPHRGKKNEPAFLQHTFNCLLELRKMSSDELSAQLWKNSCKIFLSGQ